MYSQNNVCYHTDVHIHTPHNIENVTLEYRNDHRRYLLSELEKRAVQHIQPVANTSS